MKTFLKNAMSAARQFAGVACVALAVALALSLVTGRAMADDDITTTVASVAGYWTAIKAVAIAVLLFVLGRKILRKL